MQAPSRVGQGPSRPSVEIVRWRPKPPDSPVVRRARRIVGSLGLLGGVAAVGAVVIALTVPRQDDYYTPLLGSAIAVALGALGSSLIAWTKLVLPPELAVERRPPELPRPAGRLRITRLPRRPLLAGALTLGAAAAATPLIVRQFGAGRAGASGLERTGWDPAGNGGRPVRLVREDGSPVRPEDVSVGGMVTVFPGIPGGTSNRYADSPVMLIHLRAEDAAKLRENLYDLNRGSPVGDFVAYSKICTHVGCPASLYEQQTNRLLCPCHQSQFLVTDNARPVFGPATRSLAMLPIALDDAGYFVATSDFKVPVGPSYWER
ncbi:MAG TPA: Rieske 2Fe-2S domain-containing protein [Natronosporangium sp.]